MDLEKDQTSLSLAERACLNKDYPNGFKQKERENFLNFQKCANLHKIDQVTRELLFETGSVKSNQSV